MPWYNWIHLRASNGIAMQASLCDIVTPIKYVRPSFHESSHKDLREKGRKKQIHFRHPQIAVLCIVML